MPCVITDQQNLHISGLDVPDTQREEDACSCHAAANQEQGSTVHLLKAARAFTADKEQGTV